MASQPIKLEEAIARVERRVRPLPAEPVELREALGRRLGEDVVASAPVQGFDNSAMDGYAVRAADTGERTELRVVGESAAGRPAEVAVGADEAVAISTGAMLPEGADAVLRVERAAAANGHVRPAEPLQPGTDVRRAGEDVAAGATVLRAGNRIGPAELGVLASLGCAAPLCHRRPRLAVLTSGDELARVGEDLPPGGVFDSNSLTVPALAAEAGAEVVSVAWAPDDPEATRAAVAAALDADVAVGCGGVSVGRHDHVKAACADLGVEEEFWRVALKPGGPTWFGTKGSTLVFGLPGNPVSAMVTFLLLVRPALIALAGGTPGSEETVAILDAGYEREPGRAHAVRCRLDLREDGWHALPAPRQGSHVLTSMLGADALAILPAESEPVRAGERIRVALVGRGCSR
jgi:molybdopterin molybdotransferase